MVTKVSGTEGVDLVKDGTLVVADAKAGQAVGFQKMQLFAAQETTSGAFKFFTGIPSWAKRITLMLDGVRTNGSSPVILRLGTSAGIEASGYAGATLSTAAVVGTLNNTTGVEFNTGADSASTIRNGTVQVSNLNSNTWTVTGFLGDSAAARSTSVGYSKTLPGTLDRIRLTTVNGTDTFSAGGISILVEGYE